MADTCIAALANQVVPSATTTATTTAVNSPTSARTLPRQHCYTNAAPTRMEGNVFRYDFIKQADCPPVNRKLKPKASNTPLEATHKSSVEDKPPEEFPAKPPVCTMEQLSSKLSGTKLQSSAPPSVDRKCKPNAYKVWANIATLTTNYLTGYCILKSYKVGLIGYHVAVNASLVWRSAFDGAAA